MFTIFKRRLFLYLFLESGIAPHFDFLVKIIFRYFQIEDELE